MNVNDHPHLVAAVAEVLAEPSRYGPVPHIGARDIYLVLELLLMHQDLDESKFREYLTWQVCSELG